VTTFTVDLKFQINTFSNRMDVEKSIVAYFKILPEYLAGESGENNEISVSIAGLGAYVQ
jgi:hypothetical protein